VSILNFVEFSTGSNDIARRLRPERLPEDVRDRRSTCISVRVEDLTDGAGGEVRYRDEIPEVTLTGVRGRCANVQVAQTGLQSSSMKYLPPCVLGIAVRDCFA